ncbi:hypothetical protein HU200_002995 [Digitaria exilis]|uniref:FH2 domain-containing protein n=1 Tax=Digitaria exilis TaxID=1010633 RepID=A0A835FVS0_9POAL|nr:hypothetical protein HU200_002995 [Digitaria exilis]
MGLAMKCVLLLFTASIVLVLLNLEALEGALRLASRERGEVGVVAVTGDVCSGFVSRFRMLIGLDHRRSRHRRHQHSSEALAPAPATSPHEARAPAPAPAHVPLPHTGHSRMPVKNRSHVAPVRSVARKLGGGNHTRLPKAAIVALTVAGACLLVLGIAIAAVFFRRTRKLQRKPFKLFHGSRTHRSPCATMKVSSYPSPDMLSLSSAVQCQDDYAILKGSSKSMSLSTPSKSVELIVSGYTVKTNVDLQSVEADSFHSISCSRSSGGSITESPLQICDKTITDPSPSSPHTGDSPSGSSYQSLSPDFRTPSSPKSPASTASDRPHASSNPFYYPPEKQDIQETANTTGSMAHPESPREEQDNSNWFMNPSSGYKSTSNVTETTASETNTPFSASNAIFNLDSKETSRNSAERAEFKPSHATSVLKSPPPPPKSPPPPPPPKKTLSSLKGHNSGQPPLPPPLPIQGACRELRSSKLFLRLLEAVLKTGNRMNVGTIRGGASAFRLDALLKLSDIRGADGKTTLLHFVVQEMVRSQGLKVSDKICRTPGPCHATPTGREDCLEMGQEFLSDLSNELGNVKKVASIDMDTLKSSISNLSHGLAQLSRLIGKDLTSNDSTQNFLHCMRSFQTHAENTMQELKLAEAEVLQQVRELTEYYHGEFGKNESNLLHIFVIMRDFLGLLDKVCREMRGSKHIQHLNIVLPLR